MYACFSTTNAWQIIIMDKKDTAKVLIVDDDPVQLQIVISYLNSSDYELFIAKSRADVFKALERNAIDLILLDINLPDGNGIDICRDIRSMNEFSDELSIMFMTGHHSNEKEAEGLSVGANDYIYKPVNPDVLKARINVQLQQLRKTRLLSHYAKVDALTELGNRRAFDNQIIQEVKRGQRENAPVSLLTLDIDFFKSYNDHYGHPQGDKCLREVARCINEECQRPSDFAYRVGGEEFAIVLYNTSITGANIFADKLKRRLKDKQLVHEYSTVSPFVTLSIGISDTLMSEFEVQALIKDSDAMLYRAKASGRNQAVSREWLAAI